MHFTCKTLILAFNAILVSTQINKESFQSDNEANDWTSNFDVNIKEIEHFCISLDFIIKNRGQINFQHDMKNITFEIDVEKYYENAHLLKNATERLELLCSELKTITRCNTFLEAYRADKEVVESGVRFVKNALLKRSKRGFFSIAGYVLKEVCKMVMINTAIGGVIIAYNKFKNTEYETVDIKDEIKRLDKRHINYEKQYQENMNLKNTKEKEYYETLEFLAYAKLIHANTHNKLMAIINDKINDQFFEIIDYANLTEKLTNLKNSLSSGFTIIDEDALLKLSRIHANKRGNTIFISINVPIIENREMNLYGIIPTPYLQNNSTFIINMNSVYFFLNSTNKALILPTIEYNQCEYSNELTLCNSMQRQSLPKPDLCIDIIILKNDTIHCPTKELANNNYYIKTSKNSVYFHILRPISLKITCTTETDIRNLTKNTEIEYGNECDIFEMISEIRYDKRTDTITKIYTPIININFTMYDPFYNNRTYNVTQIDRDNIILLKNSEMIKDKLNQIKTNGYMPKGLALIINPIAYTWESFVEYMDECSIITQICVYSLITICIIRSFYKILTKC